MKKIFIIVISLLTFNINSQNYTRDDFKLKGNIKRVSVLCYEYELVDGQYIEGLPYSTQTKYHTDLNLHYLEFDNTGRLNRSLLYYPRDFYGQFSWLKPEFDLESSDFSSKKNYLKSMQRYKYIDSTDFTEIIITSEDGTEVNLKIDDNKRLTEDEYYTYTESALEEKSVLIKKRKGSDYGYRRKETITTDNKTIINEYINNRFLVSKEVITRTQDTMESIFVTQSRIELKKDLFDSSKRVVKRNFVNLNWKNKFLKWPEIDFDEAVGFDTFLRNLERDSEKFLIEYIYDDSDHILIETLSRVSYDNIVPLRSTKYIYNNELISRIVIDPNPQLKGDIFFKEYVYDSSGNWIEKIIGVEKNKKGESVRVPTKKYVKTLTYWN